MTRTRACRPSEAFGTDARSVPAEVTLRELAAMRDPATIRVELAALLGSDAS